MTCFLRKDRSLHDTITGNTGYMPVLLAGMYEIKGKETADMDQDILTIRARLEKLTDTLKRNRENVPLEVLKTKYKKGYDALSKDLSRTVSGYILLKVLHDVQIHIDFQEPVMQLINRTTEQSRFLQQISHAIFEKQDLEECDRLAEQLRQKILDELEIFCLQHIVLILTEECLENPQILPQLYSPVIGCYYENNKWIPASRISSAADTS